MRAVVAFLAIGVAIAGSGCGSPSQPSPEPLNVTGTWSGPASDSSGPGQITWQITQTATSISGTLTMTDAATGVTGRGSISGTVSGSSLHFSMAVPLDGFDSPYAGCSADVSGDAQSSSSSITGTYAGVNSCTGVVSSGQVALTRSS